MKIPVRFVSKMNRLVLANAKHQVLTAVLAARLTLVGQRVLLKVKHVYVMQQVHVRIKIITHVHAWEGAQTPLKNSYPWL